MRHCLARTAGREEGPVAAAGLGGRSGLFAYLRLVEVFGANTVYAIINDGAHQYRVEEGQILDVQRKDLPEDAETIEFDRVLFVGDLEDGSKLGQPVVEGAKVTAQILGEIKGEKIIIQKFRRRKGYALKKGHRQRHLRVKVQKIEA